LQFPTPELPKQSLPTPLPASAQVTSVILTVGDGGMRNASVYVGSNSASVFSNTRVAVRRLPTWRWLAACAADSSRR
jgi:hypothetical protein